MLFIFVIGLIAAVNSAVVPCKDRSNQCAYYKSTGWYVCGVGSYMYDYCKKTCGYCNGRSIPLPPAGCHDFEKNCPMWVKNGYCTSNTKFMSKYCCKACKAPVTTRATTTTTMPPPLKCRDVSPSFCQTQGFGECKFNTVEMYKRCKLTCKMCAPGKNCLDLDINCPQYKDLGYCKASSEYQYWMLRNCKFTCLNC
ncbi:zinc metalloproteinase nas-14-like [Hydractinia symbiolongicarpus]|uniref:zinc metalloproteinase nas-14-like n=1 Tax=Hydractinia symbiolongicarpus TaxID=13093 RepID=UPI00254C3786|nr:zinc metalloproteinase nas-14-like [Hydractinia symbiolongicarpus]